MAVAAGSGSFAAGAADGPEHHLFPGAGEDGGRVPFLQAPPGANSGRNMRDGAAVAILAHRPQAPGASTYSHLAGDAGAGLCSAFGTGAGRRSPMAQTWTGRPGAVRVRKARAGF